MNSAANVRSVPHTGHKPPVRNGMSKTVLSAGDTNGWVLAHPAAAAKVRKEPRETDAMLRIFRTSAKEASRTLEMIAHESA
ncbi:hypothetical protein GCM10011326_46460 [Salipiger profundus]|nr:hypothetical protein GCM10011326_46460 [Salipiger profundus]